MKGCWDTEKPRSKGARFFYTERVVLTQPPRRQSPQ